LTVVTDLDTAELSAALQAREFSCVEVMIAYLERIDTFNPALNAIVALRPREQLLDAARQADNSPRRGWLHGIPIAIKDLADTQDLCTTYGSPIFAGHVPDRDCRLVARLREAGAIVIGKTNAPEFGLGSQTYNAVYGVTRNPYDTRLTAGGSSGGAACALAARLLPLADGSDMMGSLRNPAAFNNVYGFRPSAGRVPEEKPRHACQLPLSTSGPMARSIIDIAMMLDTIAETVRSQPWSLTPQGSCAQAVRQVSSVPPATAALSGKRIGWIGDANGFYPMDKGLLTQCEQALSVFEKLGCHVTLLDPRFDLHALFDAWCTLRSFSIACDLKELYEDPLTRELLKPEAQWEIERGLSCSSAQLDIASQTRTAWFAHTAALFEQFDALCLPSAAVYPFDAHSHWPDCIDGTTMNTYHEWMSVVIPASLAGLPALALPAGFNEHGQPAGIQLIGRFGQDSAILESGEAYHLATRWPERCRPDDQHILTSRSS
jgi:amidase